MLAEKMIRGAGNTCIFFHNSCLSQHMLEGKHPSSIGILYSRLSSYKNVSKIQRRFPKGNALYAYSEPSQVLSHSQHSAFHQYPNSSHNRNINISEAG